MEIFSVDRDGVVDATVSLGKVDYEYALNAIFPLIDRLQEQRDIQNPKFYERLRRDIMRGCLMPPITIAFIYDDHNSLTTKKEVSDFVEKSIDEGFVLDGIQRLSALKRAHDGTDDADFPYAQALYINIIVCPSIDNLLYRMITLNNGQKPMTARHQVEILSSNAFSFADTSVELVKEKERRRLRRGVFKKADFELAYMAFLSSSVNVDSQKIIEQKLDELLAAKILERDPTEKSVEFRDVIDLIGRLCTTPRIDAWFKVTNNLIGFNASIRKSYFQVNTDTNEDFEEFITRFEDSFKAFDVSRIKLGRARRQSVAALVKSYGKFSKADQNQVTEALIEVLE